jgi:hypothetical protein
MGMCLGSHLNCLYSRGDDQVRVDEMAHSHTAHNAENKLMKIINYKT